MIYIIKESDLHQKETVAECPCCGGLFEVDFSDIGCVREYHVGMEMRKDDHGCWIAESFIDFKNRIENQD